MIVFAHLGGYAGEEPYLRYQRGDFYESSGGPFSSEISSEYSLEISHEVGHPGFPYSSVEIPGFRIAILLYGSPTWPTSCEISFEISSEISLKISHENGPPELS